MYRSQVPPGGMSSFVPMHFIRRPAATWAALGIASLVAGGLFLPAITAYLGIFPTLFLGSVIATCVGMQLSELVAPEQPQP